MLKIFILLASSFYFASCEDIIVTLPNGQIRGSVVTSYRNKIKFYGFIGIPYAAPPVGNLRFMAPHPASNWNGILDTKINHKICYQVQRQSQYETEDCLYLSVYTPVKPGTNAKLPVIVNIYGGAYIHGYQWGEYMKPQYVLEQDIVVVSFNYRVGPFGFLSTGDAVIPGNMGLKDQQMALKWVHTNIHLFGGDPAKVTLMGQSAGAASVTYHLLSSGSAGLFRAAVAQSSSALCGWASQRNPADIAYGIAAEIDSSFTKNKTHQQLLRFLQSVEASAIDGTGDKYHAFAPVVEVVHNGAMITQPMYESVANGQINKVPLIIGFNSEEEIEKVSNPSSMISLVRHYDNNPRLLVNADMNINDNNVALTVGEKIRKIYTDGLLADSVSASVKYFSDNQYVRAVIKYAELQSQYTDVYLYQFSYHGKLGNHNLSLDGVYGVAHAEDLRYFWTYFSSLSSFPQSDINTVDRYVALVTNFAKTLNPTSDHSALLQNIKWTKLTKNNLYYLDIDTNLQVKKNPREFSYEKWVNLYDTYGTRPFISY